MKRLLIGLAVLALLFTTVPVFAASFDATITWTDNSTNETGFKVYRKIGTGGTFLQVGQVGPGIVAYTDTGLLVNTNYCYQVGAFNTVSELLSPETCATTGAPVSGAPGAPGVTFTYRP